MRLFRGFDPWDDEIITKAIIFAKKVVLAYYDKKASEKPSEIQVFTDNERAKIHKEINDTLEFILDKSHVGTDIDDDLWQLIFDIVLSAATVYHQYLKDESGNLVSEGLEAEFDAIKKVFRLFDQEQEFNSNLYLKLYEEMKYAKKIIEYEPDYDEFPN